MAKTVDLTLERLDALEAAAREVRFAEDWPEVTATSGDSIRRKHPHSILKLNTHASWAVGPPRKDLLHARADATFIAAASPDVVLRLIAVVRAARRSLWETDFYGVTRCTACRSTLGNQHSSRCPMLRIHDALDAGGSALTPEPSL